MGVFNNREIAIGIWMLAALIFCIVKKTIWGSVLGLVAQFFKGGIWRIYLFALAYTWMGIYLLYLLNWWAMDQLKDTMLWCIFSILPTVLTFNKVREHRRYFKEAVISNFKFTAFLEFATNLYVFGLLTELLSLPLLFIVIGVLATINAAPRQAAVKPLFECFLLAYGGIVLWHTVRELVVHYREFSWLLTLQDFLFPVFLATWFLPFMYLLNIYLVYESGFRLMSLDIKDRDMLISARYRALLIFNLNWRGFERWRKSLMISVPANREELKVSMKAIRQLQMSEQKPPVVAASDGWSPYKAKFFLVEQGLITEYYSKVGNDEWMAASSSKPLDREILGNRIAFFVEGSEVVAEQLSLSLHVNHPQLADDLWLIYLTLQKFCIRRLHY